MSRPYFRREYSHVPAQPERPPATAYTIQGALRSTKNRAASPTPASPQTVCMNKSIPASIAPRPDPLNTGGLP